MPFHGNNGKINTTTVIGNTIVGLHDGSGGVNIIIDDASHTGLTHPSGAIRVNSGTGTSYYDASGAAYSNHLFGPGK